MSKENESSQGSRFSKGTLKASQLKNSTNKVNNTNNNEYKVTIDDKNTCEDDDNSDNLSFCSDDTAELITDANNYLVEDEDLIENEKLLLTEPKYHKNLRCVTQVNLSRTSISMPNNPVNNSDLNEAKKNQTGSLKLFLLSISLKLSDEFAKFLITTLNEIFFNPFLKLKMLTKQMIFHVKPLI